MDFKSLRNRKAVIAALMLLVLALCFAACAPKALPSVDPAVLAENAEAIYSAKSGRAADTVAQFGGEFEELLAELGLEFGGEMVEGNRSASLTLGVPLAEYDAEVCYKYAALILALEPSVEGVQMCSVDNLKGVEGHDSETLSVGRELVEEHYADSLDRPLSEYGESLEQFKALIAAVKDG